MKFVYNIEVSNMKEVVFSHKVMYIRNEKFDYEIDTERTSPKIIERKSMPEYLTAKEMADCVRSYIGRKKWKVVVSLGTINIFKKSKKNNNVPVVKKVDAKKKKGKKE